MDRLVVSSMPFVPKAVVGRVARRYVAGETLGDAVRVVKDLAREGVMATIDVLGEDITERRQAEQAVTDYIAALDAIIEHRLDANISVKPTMFGLKLDRQFCHDNLARLVDAAKERNIFVRLDMEDSSCTDDTFWLTTELRKRWEKTGVVIQAYLRRTTRDLEQLIAAKTNIRVCKGIYSEARAIAWKPRDIIIRNFGEIVDRLLAAGNYVGIATHHEACVWLALQSIERLKLPREAYEFQMLLGVDTELRRILVAQGHRMRVYVPFGKSWYAYSMRRLKENPEIAGHVFRALIAGKK